MRAVHSNSNAKHQQQQRSLFDKKTGAGNVISGNSYAPVAATRPQGNAVRFFFDQDEKEKFVTKLNEKRAERCGDQACRTLRRCCHHMCPDDGMRPIRCYKIFYSYHGYDNSASLGPVLPTIPGVSQVILADANGQSAQIVTYTGVPIVPAVGQIMIGATQGFGVDNTTPNDAIFILSGIKDANFLAVPGAHMLNTRWLIQTTATAGTWDLLPIDISDLRVDDYIQIKRFKSASDITPATYNQVVRLTNVNCIEQTIEWETTNYAQLNAVRVVYVECLTAPTGSCGLCSRSPGACNNMRCGKFIAHHTLDSSRLVRSMKDAGMNKQRIQAIARPLAKQVVKDNIDGHHAIAVDPKTGNLTRGRNCDRLDVVDDATRRKIWAAHESHLRLVARADELEATKSGPFHGTASRISPSSALAASQSMSTAAVNRRQQQQQQQQQQQGQQQRQPPIGTGRNGATRATAMANNRQQQQQRANIFDGDLMQ